MDLSAEEILKNIAALKNKVGDARTGGKGSQRRKVKVVQKATAGDDKKVKTIAKKIGAHPLGLVDEVNFFKDDNTVLHFTRPEVYAAPQSNTFIITGEPQTKTIKDLLPGVIQQLGPKQFATLQDLIKSEVGDQKGDDAPPDLVAADLNKPE